MVAVGTVEANVQGGGTLAAFQCGEAVDVAWMVVDAADVASMVVVTLLRARSIGALCLLGGQSGVMRSACSAAGGGGGGEGFEWRLAGWRWRRWRWRASSKSAVGCRGRLRW